MMGLVSFIGYGTIRTFFFESFIRFTSRENSISTGSPLIRAIAFGEKLW